MAHAKFAAWHTTPTHGTHWMQRVVDVNSCINNKLYSTGVVTSTVLCYGAGMKFRKFRGFKVQDYKSILSVAILDLTYRGASREQHNYCCLAIV